PRCRHSRTSGHRALCSLLRAPTRFWGTAPARCGCGRRSAMLSRARVNVRPSPAAQRSGMRIGIARCLLALLLGGILSAGVRAGSSHLSASEAYQLLVRLLSPDDATRASARVGILRSSDLNLLPALVDLLFFASTDGRPDVVACLEGLSGHPLGSNYRYW